MASGFPLHFLCLWSCKRALGNGILSLTFFTHSPLPPWPNKNQLGENRTPCGMNLYFLKLKLCLNYFPRSVYRINTNFQNTFCNSCSFSFLIRFLSITHPSDYHIGVSLPVLCLGCLGSMALQEHFQSGNSSAVTRVR